LFLLLEGDGFVVEIPVKSCERSDGTEGDVLRGFPGETKFVGKLVNICKRVCKAMIVRASLAGMGEIDDGERHVFVEFFRAIVWEKVTTIPVTTSIVMPTAEGYDTFSLNTSMGIVDWKIFTKYADEEVVVNPFGDWANAV